MSPDKNQMYRCGTIVKEISSISIHSLLVIFDILTFPFTLFFYIFCPSPLKPAKSPFHSSSSLPASLPENAHPVYLLHVR